MRVVITIVVLLSAAPIARPDDVRGSPDEQFRKLATDYEAAVSETAGQPRAGKGEGLGKAVRRAAESRAYAARFLKLAEDNFEAPAAIDALGWVLRHARSGPEVEAAVLQLGERHLQDDRLSDLCALVTPSVPSEAGERLLRRLIESSPHREVREQACLALAFYETRLGKEARRTRSIRPEQKGRWIAALGQAGYDRLASLDPSVLDRQANRSLRRLADEDATILRGTSIRTFLTLLATNPAPAADEVLRRLIEVNPDPDIQDEARWALVIRLMRAAHQTAILTTTSPEARRRLLQDWGRDRVARLEATDPSARASEIDRLLTRLTDHAGDRPLPGVASEFMAMLTRLSDDSSEKAYHSNVDTLLRRVSEANPDRWARAVASFALAKHERGLAHEIAALKLAPRQAIHSWAARLGSARAGQLSQLDPSRLNADAERLLERVAHDYADVPDPNSSRPLGRQAEAVLNELRGPAIGRAAPEIAGDDVDGRPMKLSDYRSKVVLLTFGCHDSCPPCRAMYPYEATLAKRLSGKPFALLGFDVSADPRSLAQAMKAEGLTWRSWCEPGDGPVAGLWVSEGIPLLFLIDPEGVIRARYVGFPGEGVLDHAIDTLLKERPEKGPG